MKSEKETTYSTYSLSVHGLFQCTVCMSSGNERNRCRCRSDSRKLRRLEMTNSRRM